MSTLILQATEFAVRAHAQQTRKDGITPYIVHPIRVAGFVNEALRHVSMQHDAAIAAALLHDTLEDTATTFDELVANFGLAIASIVQELTDDKSLPKAERKKIQLATASQLSDPAALIRIADKIANCLDINSVNPSSWPQERRLAYLDWAAEVVGSASRDADGIVRGGEHYYLASRFTHVHEAQKRLIVG